MTYILFDPPEADLLYPLAATDAVATIRWGIFSFKEWWEHLLGEEIVLKKRAFLHADGHQNFDGICTYIRANWMPEPAHADMVCNLQPGEGLCIGETLLAYCIEGDFQIESISMTQCNDLKNARILLRPWQTFQLNDAVLRMQFQWVKQEMVSAELPEHVTLIGTPDQIHICPGAVIEHAIINVEKGPVYIGANAEIWEGACIRGPFALGEHSVVKMRTVVYGATTTGPWCSLGGEVKNAILQGYSNKAHDGYLGDSYVGEWCNFGAGTSNSNLKNTAGLIHMWVNALHKYEPVGNKCGVVMGNYSRTAINTSINTGSVIGISAHAFGQGLTPKYFPDFSWGTQGEKYQLEKAMSDIQNWKQLKNQILTEHEKNILNYLYQNL